jgi:hypothetical protein
MKDPIERLEKRWDTNFFDWSEWQCNDCGEEVSALLRFVREVERQEVTLRKMCGCGTCAYCSTAHYIRAALATLRKELGDA